MKQILSVSVEGVDGQLCHIQNFIVSVTHFGMFVPTLISFGTPEQQEEWVKRAWNCQVIGSYVQTEISHGTFIRGGWCKLELSGS